MTGVQAAKRMTIQHVFFNRVVCSKLVVQPSRASAFVCAPRPRDMTQNKTHGGQNNIRLPSFSSQTQYPRSHSVTTSNCPTMSHPISTALVNHTGSLASCTRGNRHRTACLKQIISVENAPKAIIFVPSLLGFDHAFVSYVMSNKKCTQKTMGYVWVEKSLEHIKQILV